MSQIEWFGFFLRDRGLLAPDGRPLYAYRVSGRELVQLSAWVRDLLPHALRTGTHAHRFELLFCLYAAEIFRREHAEGAWAWHTVFEPLRADVAPMNRLSSWCAGGLQQWKRPLLYSRAGDRQFLVTLACEGGLPLRVLERQGAKLTAFFEHLLESYYRAPVRSSETAVQVAEQNAFYLPRTLRQDVVLHLGAELIAALVELWQDSGGSRDTGDPIAALDAAVPSWRERLPLRAEDDAVNALLRPLVSRVKGLAQAASAKLRWRGLLRQGVSRGWEVENRLDFPPVVGGPVLRQWLACAPEAVLPPRLRVVLVHGERSDAVAWLSRGRGSGDNANYHLELLRARGASLRDSEVLEAAKLELLQGECEQTLPAQFAAAWSEVLPWVFVERNGALERLCEGGARTRATCAWVVLPRGFDTAPDAEGSVCEQLGAAALAGRTVVRVSGRALLTSPDGVRYVVTCGAEEDTEEFWTATGSLLKDTLGREPVYLGLPKLVVERADGQRAVAVNGRIEWRAVSGDGAWRQDSNAAGKLWLRYVDNAGGERFRRQVQVLPQVFTCKRQVSDSKTEGGYLLRGLQGASVRHASAGATALRITTVGDEVTVHCPPLTSTSLPELSLSLQWSGSAPVEFQMTYPQRGAMFLMNGRPLSDGGTVPLDRCGGARLLVQDPIGGQRYEVLGEMNDTWLGSQRAGFFESLPLLSNGRIELSLQAWQDRLQALLACSDKADEYVRLDVMRTQKKLARACITRFDARLVPEHVARRVNIEERVLLELGAEGLARIELSLLPLWDPAREPLPLARDPSRDGSWLLPAVLEPGPWWVIGRDGDWARFRPLLWVAKDDTAQSVGTDSVLAAAVRLPDEGERITALDAVLTSLTEEPDHPDWPLLSAYIELGREFPPTLLDVLKRLAAHPRALVHALLRADDAGFDRVWSLADGLPFLWVLLPVTEWLSAARRWLGGIQEALGDLDVDGAMVRSLFVRFRERAVLRHRCIDPLCDWLQESLWPAQRQGKNSLSVARVMPATIHEFIQDELVGLQSRHDEKNWPRPKETLRLAAELAEEGFRFQQINDIYRGVRCAPFVAAERALLGDSVSSELLLELRLLRAFDSQWFDSAYTYAITLGLAKLVPAQAC